MASIGTMNLGARSALRRASLCTTGLARPVAHSPETHPLVHIVDVDDDEQRLLSGWFAAAGMESRCYVHLGAFLQAHRAEEPGCLIMDAQAPAISGLVSQAILLPLAISYPIILTVHAAEIPTPIEAGLSGAIAVLARPLGEREMVAAVQAALETDRQRRQVATQHSALRARFSTLTDREREVMGMVTRGMLNKQIAMDLLLSVVTVKIYRGAAMRKMRARSLAELVRMADVIGDYPAPRSAGSTSARIAAAVDRHTDCTLAPC
jgi:FixJ family two-component response regulator